MKRIENHYSDKVKDQLEKLGWSRKPTGHMVKDCVAIKFDDCRSRYMEVYAGGKFVMGFDGREACEQYHYRNYTIKILERYIITRQDDVLNERRVRLEGLASKDKNNVMAWE